MAGKSAKDNNRGLSLFSNFVSGKARDFRTSANAFRTQQKVLATGGNQSLEPGNGYKYHFFTSPGNFVVSRSPGALIEYVVVGGGGGGGNNGGGNLGAGGGGAGGYLEGSTRSLSVATYPVVIGPGAPTNNTEGVDSTALGLTAYGGGKGVTHGDGTPGGSGGGAAYNDLGGFGLNPSTPAPVIASFPGYTPGTTQGYPGGPGAPSPGSKVPGSGGGGAGGAGQPSYPGGTPSPGTGAGGGIGRAAFSGDTGVPPSYGTLNPGSPGRWFAGGGGGGAPDDAPSGVALGGIGGGGNGARTSASVAGTTNTGGGGGAGAYDSPGSAGSGGGSGIVIIRYLA